MTEEQKCLLDIFYVFVDICEKYKLRYYLAGGTLLGAIRHKGFIPWDDDIDIIMPNQDYQKFLELECELPNNLILRSEWKDPKYPFYFCELYDSRMKPSKDSKGLQGIYLDIFPVVSSRVPSVASECCFNIISVIGYVLQVKTGWKTYHPYKKYYARLGYQFLKLFSIAQLRWIRKRLITFLSIEKTDFCFSPGGGHKGLVEFYPKVWFDAIYPVLFEGRYYPAPVGWDSYLKQLYGDYMTLPEIGKRTSHHKNCPVSNHNID